MSNLNVNDFRIAIIGLGYVGLPLAVEFGKQFLTIGYDINKKRINELQNFVDITNECDKSELMSAQNLSYSADIQDISKANIYIITVPTPVDKDKRPDLTPLKKASETVGKVLNKNDIVIYESTVYPGATEEDCVPVLEEFSGLRFNEDFYVGYSPERINPGDKKRRVSNIVKVTSGSTESCALTVDWLYSKVITAGTHKASSIKVAEAAKIIENTQRDVNIALINELYHIFNHMGINTNDVIEAAATKWNFMKLNPGLVGGHCISVDPYYLLEKSKSVGYIPDLIRKSREINDGMAQYIVSHLIDTLIKNRIEFLNQKFLILGAAFKENCPDIRNTKIVDVYHELKELSLDVDIYDPIVSKEEFYSQYNIQLIDEINQEYEIILLLVPHKEILSIIKNLSKNTFVFDFKGALKK
ncbi:nucleotide sugar dehydrogenase [Proteus terrae]|uniref:nucleotide sugar dehydrogenase n=1 Tax=Proteus terrae TaxID=1574161 RepID=UPI001330B390|nr:nucleotide sugar dehydrogenase [Proteus terrae]QKD70344.1 nucleotide sugar dehydrogenase [Proteus terrae subsp. cibarius]QKD72172.1 nucleotide sugar dehydrogenase [Proteus terrae subsp. cibarius]UDF26753.1 nucleotide sugar dehydrogenase [Proteus terrae subsp. cibarius]